MSERATVKLDPTNGPRFKNILLKQFSNFREKPTGVISAIPVKANNIILF